MSKSYRIKIEKRVDLDILTKKLITEKLKIKCPLPDTYESGVKSYNVWKELNFEICTRYRDDYEEATNPSNNFYYKCYISIIHNWGDSLDSATIGAAKVFDFLLQNTDSNLLLTWEGDYILGIRKNGVVRLTNKDGQRGYWEMDSLYKEIHSPYSFVLLDENL